MTTMITIDAHAGWDVEITTRSRSERNVSSGGTPVKEWTQTERTFIVKANTKHNESIWDGQDIVSIREIKK